MPVELDFVASRSRGMAYIVVLPAIPDLDRIPVRLDPTERPDLGPTGDYRCSSCSLNTTQPPTLKPKFVAVRYILSCLRLI